MFKVLRDEPYFTMKVTPNVFLNLILLAHEGNFFVLIDIFFWYGAICTSLLYGFCMSMNFLYLYISLFRLNVKFQTQKDITAVFLPM